MVDKDDKTIVRKFCQKNSNCNNIIGGNRSKCLLANNLRTKKGMTAENESCNVPNASTVKCARSKSQTFIGDGNKNKSDLVRDDNEIVNTKLKKDTDLKKEASRTDAKAFVEPELVEFPQANCDIPEVLRKQGTPSFCSSNAENTCPCNTLEAVEQISKQVSYCDRRNWVSVDRLNELRKRAQDAIKNHKTFTIRGCFFSIRNALVARGWVEKLDQHRKHSLSGICQVTYEDLTQTLPKRKPGESRRQYSIKCERNIMSRFLEHVPIDFLWTARKEKCDYIDQAKNPTLIINKFHRVPFTSKEGLCTQLHDFHWFYEEGISELGFPRCYNVWNPDELNEFIDNFRLTACISFLRYIVDTFKQQGYDSIFAETAKIPFSAIDFGFKRCNEFVDSCRHIDIDTEEPNIRIWEHDWDVFLTQHFLLTHEKEKIQLEIGKPIENLMDCTERLLELVRIHWPQYNLDGYHNIWIVKPANKCRGRGIQLMNNIRKISTMINPPIATKSRYVVQKYLERPLIIHNTKFDIRQWFLVTSVQPLIIWMYKESYLRFSSQEYNLQNYHESVHLTNHAVQKKYKNGNRDERLPSENMWDCYTFQAYLRQIGEYERWNDRIYPGMKKAIIGTMLASQDNMDRRSNTFELFGADFMISEDFHPWLIEINSSPDLGATTSVTARMCPQCLEDVIKVIIDRRTDPKADTGNFEMIYRQVVPPTPAYMGLNLFLKGKQMLPKMTTLRREKSMSSIYYQQKLPATALQTPPNVISPSCLVSPLHNSLYSNDREHTAELLRPAIADLFEAFKSSDQKDIPTIESLTTLSDSLRKSASSLLSSNFNQSSVNQSPRNLSRSYTNPNLNSHRNLTPYTAYSRSMTHSPNSSLNGVQLREKLNHDRLKQRWLRPNQQGSNPSTNHHGQYFMYNQHSQHSQSDSKSRAGHLLTRRHLSCGPKFTNATPIEATPSTNATVSGTTTNLGPEDSVLTNGFDFLVKSDVNNPLSNSDSKFECVGNRCGLENEPVSHNLPQTLTSNENSVMSASAATRKQIYELLCQSKSAQPPRNAKRLPLKSKIVYSNSQPSGVTGNQDNDHITSRPFKSGISSQLNASGLKRPPKLHSKSSNSDYMASPFFAVGMSLRAWRSRYNRIMKSASNIQQQYDAGAIIPYKRVPVNSPASQTSPKRQFGKSVARKMADCHGRGNAAA